MNAFRAATLSLCLALIPGAQAEDKVDPYLYLEDVDGEKALEWVRAQNVVSQTKLENAIGFPALRQRLQSIYDSEARIPTVTQQGAFLYNFWRDQRNPRGLWRRTSETEYRKTTPAWETVLDLDRLATSENENWVWKGATCLYPDYRRCLLKLSRGGADAHVVREFDTGLKSFVPNGFRLVEAKHDVVWRNLDSVLVATDVGPDSLTSSGYPRIVKEWARGTVVTDAPTVFEAQRGDVGVDMVVYRGGRGQRELIRRAITFFEYEYHLRAGRHLAKLAVPGDAELSLLQDQLILHLRSPWHITGRQFAAGSLIAMPLVRFIEGGRDFGVLFAPTATTSLDNFQQTRNGLLLNILDQVRGRVQVLHYQAGGWQRNDVPVPDFGEAKASPFNSEQSDQFFLSTENFLEPTRLMAGDLGSPALRQLKQLPPQFNAAGLEIQQLHATSRDGTRVPYFLVGRKGLSAAGRHPTLLYGYGGFEIALTPGYRAGVGAAWLERGGVYVLANIRGGGEFGPPWHQAAIKQNRQRAYDDFQAVADDLIRRRVTDAEHLGIQGGSNGGLLVGVAMTQRPDLFGAVVSQVPLLDMQRYHRLLAGASWMSEYGDPDKPQDWAYIQRYSPYQNVVEGRRYPPTLLMTSTRDDRVHPGHARKMAARLIGLNQPTLYYENIEGGHGGAANNQQKAYMDALAYTFLWEQLR